ncbi:MAG: GC-type dockerin domain-anchored protein [Planctomycetota bacterium]
MPTRFGILPSMLLSVVTASLVPSALGQTFDWAAPSFDRWNYPFNTTPGAKLEASVFGNFDPAFATSFDERDGQLLITFDTAGQITPGQGVSAYAIESVTLTATTSRDLAFPYDPSPDPWQARLPDTDPQHIPDTDAGDALIVSGTGFRNGFDPASYGETGTYSPVGAFGVRERNAFALSFDDMDAPVDISNNVKDSFDARPWGVGLTEAVAPGASVPVDTALMFEVDVADPAIAAYFADGLNAGLLSLTISSSLEGAVQSPTIPALYCKEDASGTPVTLQIVLSSACSPADITTDGSSNGEPDGAVTLSDFSFFLSLWSLGDPAADITLDGACDIDVGGGDGVTLSDFSCFLATWSLGCP